MKAIRVKVMAHVPIIGGLQGKVADCDHKGNCKLKLWSEDGRYIGIWECDLNDLSIVTAI